MANFILCVIATDIAGKSGEFHIPFKEQLILHLVGVADIILRMYSIQRTIDSNKLSISPIKDIGGRFGERWYRYIQYEQRPKLLIETAAFIGGPPVKSRYKENTFQLAIPSVALTEVF